MIGFQRINILDQIVFFLGHRREADLDLLIAFGGNREDLESQQIGTDVLQQSRVFRLPNDAGVHRFGLIRRDQFAFTLPSVHAHRELADAGALGHRKDVGRFELLIGVIAKGLLHFRHRHLILQLHLDVVIQHRQRRKVRLGRNQQSVALRHTGAGKKQCGQEQVSFHGIPHLG